MSLAILTLPQQDVEQAYEIHALSHSNPWSLTNYADCLTPPYACLGAYQGARLIGAAVLLLVADEATLMDISIAPEQRGKGFGRQLLQQAIGYCRASEMAELWLEVRASNEPAIKLYLAHHFTYIERRKNYYQTQDGKEDAVIMRLILNEP